MDGDRVGGAGEARRVVVDVGHQHGEHPPRLEPLPTDAEVSGPQRHVDAPPGLAVERPGQRQRPVLGVHRQETRRLVAVVDGVAHDAVVARIGVDGRHASHDVPVARHQPTSGTIY